MNWSFTAPGPVRADLSLPAGSIEVEQSASGEVEVLLEPLRSGRRGDEFVQATEVGLEGDRLVVHAPTRGLRGVPLRCVVSLPDRSVLSVRTASADVRVSAHLASFNGKSASGEVRLGQVDGDCSLDTASGDLACDEVSGHSRVRGASGDVSITRAGGEVEVSVASGDVEVGRLGGSARVRTASGDVRLGRAERGTVNVNTASGDVAIGVAAGTGAYLDLSTVSGETSCGLPFSEKAATAAQLQIACKTVSGDIRIEAATTDGAP